MAAILNLIERARSAGLRITAQGEELLVRGPRSAEPLIEELRAHKAEVLAFLTRVDARDLDPDSERAIREHQLRWSIPCYACAGKLFWHRKGGPLVCCTCHPPAIEGIVYRRVRFEYVN